MIRLSLIFCTTVLVSCAGARLEADRASETVENLIHAIDRGDYETAAGYYTDNFNSSEPADVRNAKYDDLRKAFGDVSSMELISTEHSEEFGQPTAIILTYRVKHRNMSSIETFSVVEEDGTYKVSRHDIRGE